MKHIVSCNKKKCRAFYQTTKENLEKEKPGCPLCGSFDVSITERR